MSSWFSKAKDVDENPMDQPIGSAKDVQGSRNYRFQPLMLHI